jgi:hypothetical protein
VAACEDEWVCATIVVDMRGLVLVVAALVSLGTDLSYDISPSLCPVQPYFLGWDGLSLIPLANPLVVPRWLENDGWRPRVVRTRGLWSTS